MGFIAPCWWIRAFPLLPRLDDALGRTDTKTVRERRVLLVRQAD